ncbi:MAG: acetyltransferase [Micrococcaceae bacterium]|jgi:mycothiol synthase|nr:acetyltransferase [Micrococcaceae bacterium]
MDATRTQNWPVRAVTGAPDPRLLRDIGALVAAALESDGVPPLSEQTLVDLRAEQAKPDSLLVLATYPPDEPDDPATGEDLAGAAVIVTTQEGSVLEIVVHPNYRNQGVGALLVDRLKELRGLEGLKAWSHGNQEAAADLAARYGFTAVRELWRMRLSRPEQSGEALPEPQLAAPYILRTFVPGQDEDEWLRANAAAFADHPEQGGMTGADLQARMEEQWFDPAGFFLAVVPEAGAAGTIAGFCWTKVHPARAGHPPLGEIYAVGVVPGAQGTGLGKALTIAGLRHLQQAGLQAIMLYVDADNAPAVALYHRLGFTGWDADVMYAAATV